MKERLKEFFNGTFTGSDLTGTNNDEWVIIENDATTQAVVRDVIVDPLNQPVLTDGTGAAVALVNGALTIANNQDLIGSEIIETNGSLKYKLTVDPNGDVILFDVIKHPFVTGSTVLDYKMTLGDPDGFCSDLLSYSLTLNDQGALTQQYFNTQYTTPVDTLFTSMPNVSNPKWVFLTYKYAYYFNYDGNSITKLYRADITGITIGSWSVVSEDVYAFKALDVDNNAVWWVDQNKDLYKYDLEKGTQEFVAYLDSTLPATTSTYTCSGACNGLFILCLSNSYTSNLYFYDSNSGEQGALSLSTSFSVSNYSNLAVTYNKNEDKYYIFVGSGTDFYTYYLNGSPTNGDTAIYIAYNMNTFMPNGLYSNSNHIQGNNKGELFVVNGSQIPEKVKIANNAATSIETVSGVTPYGKTGWYEAVLKQSGGNELQAPVQPSDLEINLTCKVSGVEIKEVE
ncbi:hypothetical protein [Marinomonas atlantica]|uniref:hypothetical protein n=1 Tax=Marinomonas atlantica TaxID=1806668 RepID=UPI000836905E|nr:hypothetical protein [Marinomonas atlantica]